MLIVANARYDVRLWTAQDDQVPLVLPGIPQLGSILCFLHILVGHAGSVAADVDDHVVALLDPAHLVAAQLRPAAAPKWRKLCARQRRPQRHGDEVIDIRHRSVSHGRIYVPFGSLGTVVDAPASRSPAGG